MTDSAAIAAVARILRAPPAHDPDILAAHIITALRGHGWRPSNVVPMPPRYQPPAGPPLPENVVRAHAARARQAITKEDHHDA